MSESSDRAVSFIPFTYNVTSLLGKDEGREECGPTFLESEDRQESNSNRPRNGLVSLSQIDESKSNFGEGSIANAAESDFLNQKGFFAEAKNCPRTYSLFEGPPPPGAGLPLPSASQCGPPTIVGDAPSVKHHLLEPGHLNARLNTFIPPSSFSAEPLVSVNFNHTELSERMKNDFLESNESSLLIGNRFN